jgi:phosphoglucosamine mutase
VNVAVAQKRPLDSLPEFTHHLRQVERELGDRGRVLIRYSGTEAKARVMVEGENEAHVSALANELADALKRALAAAIG